MQYYDKKGNPLDTFGWGVKFEDESYRVVKQTKIGEYTISSIWLGLDHSFGRQGSPVIFETMIFGGPEEEQFRYCTEQETLDAHEKLVAKYKQLGEPICVCQTLLRGHDKGCPLKK